MPVFHALVEICRKKVDETRIYWWMLYTFSTIIVMLGVVYLASFTSLEEERGVSKGFSKGEFGG